MTSPDSNQIEQLFHRALEIDPGDRAQFLDDQCPSSKIRAEVEKLLAYADLEGGGLTDQRDDSLPPTQDLKSSAPGRGDRRQPNGRSGRGSIDHGRFLPGTVLSDRYRIVGMLGKGGMGEVYRADDLELGQSVALKFLPKNLANDQRSMERFRGEVRLARQVSHPNVCRVYDIGQTDGQWFLSMEYVDGEDLAQLLTRIGRFNAERATQLARQLCMGLHAAHEQGVVHRDLKPANVMIDGRGKLMITDFGLAEVAGNVREEDIRSGTPAYMAPEQLAGREVTTRSDLYSLGIVLHEIYTGTHVWEANSMTELLQMRRDGSTPTPSERPLELDPLAERTIQRCLEPDPSARPSSALEVVASLPGGDPLQAALAAGETPSPAMIANSTQDGQLSLKVGCSLFAALCLALVSLPILANTFQRFDFGDLARNPPPVLARIAEEHLTSLGLQPPEASAASGFDYSEPGRFEFWYRQSASKLSPNNPDSWGNASAWRVTSTNPPNLYPSMTSVRLDTSGRLIELYSTLTTQQTVGEDVEVMQDAIFAAAEIDPTPYQLSDLDESLADSIASIPHDASHFWSRGDESGELVGVLATTIGGKLNYVSVVDKEGLGTLGKFRLTPPSTFGISGLMLSVIVLAGILLAVRNLYTMQVDLRGAAKCALFVFVCDMFGWVIMNGSLYHVFANGEFTANYLIRTLALASRCGIFYLAVEPVIRRWFPTTLISVARFMEGRYRDALFAREVLVGTIFGIVLHSLCENYLHEIERHPDSSELVSLHYAVGYLLSAFVYNFVMCFGGLVVMVFTTMITGNRFVALAAFVAILMTTGIQQVSSPIDLLVLTGYYSLVAWCYARFGMVAVVFIGLARTCSGVFPFTTHFEAWYSSSGIFFCGVFAIIGAYGLYFSTIAPHLNSRRAIGGG